MTGETSTTEIVLLQKRLVKQSDGIWQDAWRVFHHEDPQAEAERCNALNVHWEYRAIRRTVTDEVLA